MIAMSNMAKMDIDISVHQEGNKPELVKFKPDPELPWTEEEKIRPRVGQGKMCVLNWKDIHFNLIVSPNHMLSQYGSITFQAATKSRTVSGVASKQACKVLPPDLIPEDDSPVLNYLEAAVRGQELEARSYTRQVETSLP